MMQLIITFILIGASSCANLVLYPNGAIVPSDTTEVQEARARLQLARDLLLERRIDIQCRETGCQSIAHCCDLLHYHLCAPCPIPVDYLSQEALEEAATLPQAIRPSPELPEYHVIETLFSSLSKTPTSEPIKTVEYEVAVDQPLAVFSTDNAGQPFKFQAAANESGTEPARPIFENPGAVGNSIISQPVENTFQLEQLHGGPQPDQPYYVEKENFVRVTPKPVTVVGPGFSRFSNSSYSVHRKSTFTRSKPVITTVTKVSRSEPVVRNRTVTLTNKRRTT